MKPTVKKGDILELTIDDLAFGALAEDLVALVAGVAEEVAHVFDDGDDGDLELVEHLDAFDDVGKADLLGGCDDDDARHAGHDDAPSRHSHP